MAVNIAGSGTVGNANVTNNHLQVVTPLTETDAGFVTLSSEIDSGDNLGSRYQKALEVSDDYRLRAGVDTTLFNTSFEGTVSPRALITENLSVFTSALSGGYYVINNAASTGVGYGFIRSYRTFPLFGTYPTYVECWVRIGQPDSDFGVTEFGLGYPTAASNTAPTDGIFFRIVGGGGIRAVTSFGGTPETVTTVTTTGLTNRDGTAFSLTACQHYLITIHNDECEFWINDVLVAVTKCPSSQPFLCSSSEQPFFARTQHSSSASSARRVEIGFINVTQGDMHTSKPYSHSLCGAGGGSYQIQQGTTSGGTVSRGAGALGWPTSGTARAAGTWTATSAPALNSLGGMWVSPAISTLASDADYPIFSYLNPAGSATLPGKTLYITGIRVGETTVTTVAATNAITLSYAAGIGSTAPATTGTESTSVIAARIVPLGQVAFTSTAAVGTFAPGWMVDFSHGPLVCPPGTYVQFIVRPFGTVTSNTLVVCGTVTFIGYYE